MRFLTLKAYFMFYILFLLMISALFAAFKCDYLYTLYTLLLLIVMLYFFIRHNLQLESVKEDKLVLSFAHIKKHILYKNIKEVKFLNIGKNNLLGDVDQFSIKTVKNKYFEVFYLVSSGDFEKIQEKVAQAHLHAGSSNVPK